MFTGLLFSSPPPRVLTFMHSSELVHPGFSSRAKIPRGKYVKRLLLVVGGICPFLPFLQSMICCDHPLCWGTSSRNSPTPIPLVFLSSVSCWEALFLSLEIPDLIKCDSTNWAIAITKLFSFGLWVASLYLFFQSPFQNSSEQPVLFIDLLLTYSWCALWC